MRTRRSVLVGVSSALVVAGCTEGDPESTSEEDTDSEATEESLAISNARLNNIPLDEYDVDFPADVTPEQLADQFQHQLEYQAEGASGPVESTIKVEYTDTTIPTEDEDPLNEQIEADVYETGTITQEIQFPDHLVEHLIENPRNIQATLQAEDTETGQTTDREFTLNYADNYVKQIHREAFDSEQTTFGDNELVNLEVEDEVINLEYNSDHEIGTDEFSLDLSSGIYSGVVETTRVPYEMNYVVNDSEGQKHEVHVDSGPAEQFLNGEITEAELSREVGFNYLRDY